MLAEEEEMNDKLGSNGDLGVPEVLSDKNGLLEWSGDVECFCGECLRKGTCVEYIRGKELHPDAEKRKKVWDRKECKYFSPK